VRVEEARLLAADLVQLGDVRAGDRDAAVERLEHGEAEALGERRQRDACGRPPQALERLVVEVAGHADAVGHAELVRERANLVGVRLLGAGEHDDDVGREVRQRAHEQRLVLVRADGGDASDDASVRDVQALAQRRLRERVLLRRAAEAVRDGGDPRGVDAQRPGDLVARGVGDGEQPVGGVRGERDQRAHRDGRAEPERAQVQERDVVQRDHLGRPGHRRSEGGERVQHVGLAPRGGVGGHHQLGREPARPLALVDREGDDPGDVAPAVLDEPGRAAAGRQHREAGVRELACERRHEPPQVGLGTAGPARVEEGRVERDVTYAVRHGAPA
jgi:hypothetical protein